MTRRTRRQPPSNEPRASFICWVPGCPSYGERQYLDPGQTYAPGQHYARQHKGQTGTPVVEWERYSGRSITPSE